MVTTPDLRPHFGSFTVSVLLSAGLGVLPWLAWAALGFAGGALIVVLYPALAIYVGWRIHRVAESERRKQVVICAAVAAAAFVAMFAVGGLIPTISPTESVLGVGVVYVGGFLIAAALIGVGVAVRYAKTS